MSFLPIRYPKLFYCKALSRKKDRPKTLYLSFDDGPNPLVTEKVLEILKKYKAKASFFCKGKNADLYPEIFNKVKAEGHTIGNHSYTHLDAFKHKNKKWLSDVLRKSPVSEAYYFRPPYGHIFPWQYRVLRKKYKLVFWDVMVYDFRTDYSLKKIKKIIFNKVRDGSIIVFHDNIASSQKMLPALEFTLEYYTKRGYKFEKL